MAAKKAAKTKMRVTSIRAKKNRDGSVTSTMKSTPVKSKPKVVDAKPRGLEAQADTDARVKREVAGKDAHNAIVTPVPRFDPNEPTVKSAAQLAASAQLMKVESQDDALAAGRNLVTVKGLINAVTEKRISLTKPLKDTAKRIEAMFKPTLDQLEGAERVLKAKVLDWRNKVQAESAERSSELMSQAVEAQDSGDNETALALATEAQQLTAPAKVIALDDGSMSARRPWDFEVVDLGSVPHEYFTLDEKKVRAAIRSHVRDIPGLRIFQKDQLAVSAAKLDVVGDVGGEVGSPAESSTF